MQAVRYAEYLLNPDLWRLSARLAWRDLGSAKMRLGFAVLAVAVGVAALSGVRGYCAAFRDMLLGNARTLLAADISASISHEPGEPEHQVLNDLVEDRASVTHVTEMMTMVGGQGLSRPLPVNLKAVDPDLYPFYGEVELDPEKPLAETLADDVILASQDLLIRLRAGIGDEVRVGEATFRVAAVLKVEPDRMTGAIGLGPRAMLSREALGRTGLLRFGSRATHRFLVRLPAEGLDVDQARSTLQAGIPGVRITDYRETSPRIRRGLERTTSFLSLVSLLAMAVGGLGVGMVVYSHLQQRLDTIAIMKCCGATSGLVLRVFVLQTLALGLLGSLVGVVTGFVLQGVAPSFVSDYFPLAPSFDWQTIPALEAIGIGVLTVLMFSVPTLLGIRKVVPALIFRREVASPSDAAQGGHRRQRLRQLATAAALLTGVGGVAVWLSDSARLGGWFVGGLAVSLAVLAMTAAILLGVLRKLPRLLPARLPTSVRHGIANLYRPGMHADVILVALGIGVTFTLTVYLLQTTVLDQLVRNLPPDMPNVFVSNITEDQHAPLEAFLREQPGIDEEVSLLPTVSARLEAINGQQLRPDPRERSGQPQERRGPRLRRTRDITWSAGVPEGLEILEGSWWSPDEQAPRVSVRERLAEYMEVGLGSTITFQAGDRRVTAPVVAIHRYEGMPEWIYDFVLNEPALAGAPATYIGGIRVMPEHGLELSRNTFEAFPSVLYVNAVDFFETIQEVVDQIAFVVRFVAGFTIVAGIIILVSCVVATRFRRLREVAILKTLGATRRRVAGIFSVEFLILGAAAGLTGSVLAVAYSALLTRDIMEVDAVIDWPGVGLTVVLSALLATASGWAASFRILGSKPLDILRDE